MTGLSLPRKSWYSYVSGHLFCFVSGLAWTKNYLLRQEEKQQKKELKYCYSSDAWNYRNKEKSFHVIIKCIFQILREHWLLSSRMWPIWILCGHSGFTGGFAHICVRGETLEGSCDISHSICSAMCKRDMENPKWYLQHSQLWDQRNCHDGSLQFQYPISDEHQQPNPQKLRGDRGQMQLNAQIPLLFQQYKAEIARKTKSGNNCYLCCHSHSASQGSLLKISWNKEHVSYSNWNADLWGWNTSPRNTVSQ